MKKIIQILLIFLVIGTLAQACKTKKRDCKGRKKTAKTNMGGWI